MLETLNTVLHKYLHFLFGTVALVECSENESWSMKIRFSSPRQINETFFFSQKLLIFIIIKLFQK